MADNVTTQSATLSTVTAGTRFAAYEGTFSGDASALVGPSVLVTVSGAEGSRTFTEVGAANPLPISDAGGSVTVDGSVSIAGTPTVDTELPTAAALADNTANPTAPAVGAFNMLWDGAAWDRAPGTAADGVLVNLGANNDVTVTGTVTVAAHAVTNAGTFAVQESGAALTALQVIDNPVVVDDAAFTPATTSVMMAGFVLDDTTPDSVNEGDAGAARMSANRNQYVQLRDGAGNERGANVNASGQLSVTVDNTVTVASHAVTNAGTFAVQESGAALTALQLLDNVVVVEDAAHGSGDSGIMALAVRKDAAGTLASADGDYTPLQTDNAGSLRVVITGGAGSGGTSAVDESGYTPTTSAGTPIMGAADETAPDTAAEGTLAIIRSTLSRALHVNLRDSAGAEVAVGGGTQYTEDAAAAANPVGTAPMLVRADTPAGIVSADGDNVAQRATNFGAAFVQVVNSSGSFVDSFGGGTSYTEDAAAAADPAGGAQILVRQDTLSSTTVSADGDNIAARAASTGAQYVEVTAGTTKLGNATDGLLVNLGANNDVTVTGTVTVGSHAVTNAGTFAVQVDGAALTALQLIDNLVLAEDAVHGSADPGVQMLAVRQSSPANLSGANGDYEPLQVNAGRLWASATIDAALPAGTNAIGGVTGTVAHDAADSSSPLKIGAKAKATLEAVTAVAADDRTDLYADLNGALITRPMAPLGDLLVERVSNTDGASTALTTFGAPGAGVRNYVTTIIVHNAHATTNGYLDIRDGTAGSVLMTIPLPATGGAIIPLPVPMRQPTANTALAIDVSAAISTIYVTLVGFQANV